MRLLLDTNVLIWSLDDDRRLGPTERAVLNDSSNTVLVSIVSLWEIVIKQRVGKLQADVQVAMASIRQSRAVLLDLTLAHLTTLTTLPRHHRDPFDHLLIAQAITESATFMSADRQMQDYPVPLLRCFT